MSAESRGALDSRLREAVEWALRGDWQAAHRIVQIYESDPTAAWIHAVVHRMEGDLDNARYWYSRCGHEPREDLSTEAELRQIAAALQDVSK